MESAAYRDRAALLRDSPLWSLWPRLGLQRLQPLFGFGDQFVDRLKCLSVIDGVAQRPQPPDAVAYPFILGHVGALSHAHPVHRQGVTWRAALVGDDAGTVPGQHPLRDRKGLTTTHRRNGITAGKFLC